MVEDFQSWLESYDLEKLFSDKRDKETIDKEMFLFVRSDDFDNYFSYDGELGALYEKEGTLLRVWTPTAKSVEVWTYADGSIRKPSQKIAMVQNALAGISTFSSDIRTGGAQATAGAGLGFEVDGSLNAKNAARDAPEVKTELVA